MASMQELPATVGMWRPEVVHRDRRGGSLRERREEPLPTHVTSAEDLRLLFDQACDGVLD
jgi:hypothetical protein